MAPVSAQVELPFENGGFTAPIEDLVALVFGARKPRYKRNATKPDLDGLDLEQPLFEVMGDGRYAYFEGSKESQKQLVALREEDIPESFGLPSIETIAKLASGLFYHHLHTLMFGRGQVDAKKEIIDWVFADTYRYEQEDLKVPMHKVPFTCQFCCALEEVDYEALRDALSERIEELRARGPVRNKQVPDFQNEQSQHHAIAH